MPCCITSVGVLGIAGRLIWSCTCGVYIGPCHGGSGWRVWCLICPRSRVRGGLVGVGIDFLRWNYAGTNNPPTNNSTLRWRWIAIRPLCRIYSISAERVIGVRIVSPTIWSLWSLHICACVGADYRWGAKTAILWRIVITVIWVWLRICCWVGIVWVATSFILSRIRVWGLVNSSGDWTWANCYMIVIIFVNYWSSTLFANLGPGLAVGSMLFISVSWDCHLAIHTLNGFKLAYLFVWL